MCQCTGLHAHLWCTGPEDELLAGGLDVCGDVVEEVGSGDWGIGGQPLSTEDVLTLARGAAVG